MWGRVSGGAARVKRKVYWMVVKTALLCGLETAALTKKHQAELEVAELKMDLIKSH